MYLMLLLSGHSTERCRHQPEDPVWHRWRQNQEHQTQKTEGKPFYPGPGDLINPDGSQEDTPPVVVQQQPEDDQPQKESQNKLVPTSEQLRLAQITQSADTNKDPQRKAKINQIMEITGKESLKGPDLDLTGSL